MAELTEDEHRLNVIWLALCEAVFTNRLTHNEAVEMFDKVRANRNRKK